MRLLLAIALLLSLPAAFCETEEQTISRCLEDIRSGELPRRRRAAMVIGKYNTPEAIEAVVLCLKDADAQVRQSALVSLTEDRTMPMEARLPVVRLLKDENVHIRRLASSVLPDCMGIKLRGRISMAGNVRIRAGGASRNQEELEELRTLINGALADADASVRMNVLNASFCYPFALDKNALLPFFKEESDLLRIMAVRAYFSPEDEGKANVGVLEALTLDKSPQVRLELAKGVLVLLNEAEPILRKLASDTDNAVALAAIEGCAKLRIPAGIVLISEALEDSRFNESEKSSLCRALRFYGESARPVLEKALALGGMLGSQAMSMILGGGFGEVPMELAIQGIASNAIDTRRAALMYLRRHGADVQDATLKGMLNSPYIEVRLALVDILRTRKKSTVGNELAKDLCADDEIRVRNNALRLLSSIRPEGWVDILVLALQEEENRDLREAAAISLCAAPREDKTIEALRAYLPNASPIVARRIETCIRLYENAKQRNKNAVKQPK